MSSHTILISCIQLQRTIDEHRERLEGFGMKLLLPTVHGQQLSEAELVNLVPGVAGIIAGDDVISRAVLERAESLRVISKWGVGVDNIDLDAASERGVHVRNTPGVFGDEVADVVIGYLVLLARGLHVIDRSVRAGDWPKPEGVSLAGLTMGIIGLGDIGREVARRCLVMRMRVLGVEPNAGSASEAQSLGVNIVGLDELFREADVVSLNCPLTPTTHHLVNATRISAMKSGAWLINTARGPIVKEVDLIDALQEGRLAAAALDVFADEPLAAHNPLRTLDNVILGSHNSSNTRDAVRRTSMRAIDNLLEVLTP
jgi:D-3-phosphoglycerate dehydrogenase